MVRGAVGVGATVERLPVHGQRPGRFQPESAYTLTAGETRSGDQVVVAQDITLEPDSSVAGDITLMGSQVTVRGQVDGDVIVVADRFVLGDEADISGNLVVCAKEFQRGAAAQVGGTIKEECARSSRVSVAKSDRLWLVQLAQQLLVPPGARQ